MLWDGSPSWRRQWNRTLDDWRPRLDQVGDGGALGPETRDGTSFSLQSIGRSAALVAVSSIAAQFFTLGRELFVASRVGASERLDAMLVALVLPTLLSGLLSSGIAAAVVPVYARLERLSDRRAARSFLAGVLTWGLVAAGVGMVALLAAPGATALIAGPGLDDAARETAAGFVPVLAPIVVLAFTSALLSTTCQINERFRAIAFGVVAGPVASLLVTVLAWDALGLHAYALAWTTSFLTTTVVLLVYAVAARLLARPGFAHDPAEVRMFRRHAIPLTISALVNQSRLLTDRAVASALAAGSVSALRYGEGLVAMPTQALAPAWALAIYPALVRTHLTPSGSFGASVHVAVRFVLAVFIPLAVVTTALAPLLVDVVYARGAFDATAAVSTAAVVAGLGPMMVLTMLQAVLVPAHNARQAGTFLLLVGSVAAVLNLALNVALGWTLGVGGIALSTSLTLTIGVVVMAVRLARDEPDFRVRELASVAMRATAASLVPAVPVAVIAWGSGGLGSLAANVVALIVLTVSGFAVYVPLVARLGLAEPGIIVRLLLGRTHLRAE